MLAGEQRPRRAEEQCGERDGAGPDGGRQHDMDEHESPRELRTPLNLANRHLHEEQRKNAEPELEEGRRAVTVGGEVADREQEREPVGRQDAVVFVVGASSSPYQMVQRAIAAVGPERVIGVVLNRASEDALPKGSYYYNYGEP